MRAQGGEGIREYIWGLKNEKKIPLGKHGSRHAKVYRKSIEAKG